MRSGAFKPAIPDFVAGELEMPITAQCRSCAARYKIVESAAGRRVKCRRCGKPIQVPSAEGPVQPGLDLRALAELERTGHVINATPEQEYEQYQSAVATVSEKEQEALHKKKDYSGINDLASPDTKKKLAAKNKDGAAANQAVSLLANLLTGLGALVFMLGIFLYVGRRTGFYPNFPFLGYITASIGSAIFAAGRKL